MRSKFFVVASLLIVASMLLGACAQQPAATPETVVKTVVVEGTPQTVVVTATAAPTEPPAAVTKTLRLNMGPGDIPTIDPALSTDTSSVQIAWELFVGLTRQDEVTNDVKPGIATKWDISEDGKTYTFTLRNDIPWVKYDAAKGQVVKVQDCEGKDRMVTAKDFEYGILRTLAPETASQYAYVLAMVLEGASAYNGGTEKDTTKVGVKANEDGTLTLKFVDPAAFNVAIAGMWVAFAQPSWLIKGDDCTEARADKWTETGFNQSYGPYALKEWVHDSMITLVKNPFWPADVASVPAAKIEEATWTMLDESPAFAEYEAGSLDAVAVPSSELDRVKSDPTLSKELVVAPNLCTYYYGFNTKAKFVDDPRVRLALSMAVDRQGLIDNVLKGGQVPAQWFSRPGLAAAPTLEDHPDLGVKFNKDEAMKLLQSYLDEKKMTIDQLDISLMFNTSSGHQMIAEAIQQMWKDNLGLTVKLVNQEWKVYLNTIKSKDTPQIWRLGWCPDYADANNFVKEVFSVGGSANPAENGVPFGGVNWKNDKFEQLVKDAAKELDPKKRLEMYAEAEKILNVDDAILIPIYWYSRNTVTKPYVTRTFGSAGQEAVEKWDVDMAVKGQ